MATTLELSFKLESDLCNNVEWGRKWFTNFNTGKLNLFRLSSLINLVLLMWKLVFSWRKSSFKMQELSFSSKVGRHSYIFSIAKTPSDKIGAFIHSMKFLFPRAALYLCKSTIRPCLNMNLIYETLWTGAGRGLLI